MTKKKSYNPFKMWGSYVGAVIGLFVGQLQNYTEINFGIKALVNIYPLWQRIAYPSMIYVIIAFLLGWGIHSLIRKLR